MRKFVIPEDVFWDLKKISYEKGVKIPDILTGLCRDYIKNNHTLLKQGITNQHD